MAKSEDGTYGSQFFITLGNTEREMNGQCTMFGRIEGDSIYNVVKIADAELVEGTDRPVFAVKITGCEVGEMGQFEGKLKKREKVARVIEPDKGDVTIKKKKKAKGAKTLLSFGGEEGEDGENMSALKSKKPKFNTKLVSAGESLEMDPKTRSVERRSSVTEEKHAAKRLKPSTDIPSTKNNLQKSRPKSPDPYAQIPVKDPEEPERSPSPTPPPAARQSILERTNAQIASLKASMRRDIAAPTETGRKKSALEAMIPETSIRGRKRPAPGSAAMNGGGRNGQGFGSGAEADALKLFNAFKAKLENSDVQNDPGKKQKEEPKKTSQNTKSEEEEDEEAQLCDLHFIANCQSCQNWNENAEGPNAEQDQDEDSTDWLSHRLQFGKDTLGKDLNWKKKHREDVDSLMVIDPREKEKEYVHRGGKSRKSGRDREREHKRERAGEREWDRR